jgi:SAM-dependent methyltransferase
MSDMRLINASADRGENGITALTGAAQTQGRIPQGFPNLIEDLVCPACYGPLQRLVEELGCPKCALDWPIAGGVPHFVRNFPYWGEIPREQMVEVNRQAETGDWKAALLKHPDPSVQRAAQMILNVERSNWHCLVNLPPGSRVLDLGAGMGANSHGLARCYREVVAVEPVLERIQFMQHRFRQERLDNIKVVRTSLWELPFAAESFDLVAMNGVLEWVAEGRSGDPEQLQMDALRNAIRVLRPGGYLYLGIENRLCLGYFVGYRDPHCGLPFVTILPRPLAHWYARKKGRNGYRNYLYSSRGYRKLLRKAGFSRVEVYLALPSYNHPRALIPLDRKIFSYFSRSFNGSTGGLRDSLRHVLLKTGMLQYFEYSFAIVAQK